MWTRKRIARSRSEYYGGLDWVNIRGALVLAVLALGWAYEFLIGF